jgi:hypothetical protein
LGLFAHVLLLVRDILPALDRYLNDFGEHYGEPFSYRGEPLSEDLDNVQELLRAVGPTLKISELKE